MFKIKMEIHVIINFELLIKLIGVVIFLLSYLYHLDWI